MLKGLLSLLGLREREKPNAPASRPRQNPLAIPVGPDDDPNLRIIAGPRAQYPKKRGKSDEQFQSELDAYHQQLRDKAAASFRLTRDRAVSAGSKTYLWRTSRDSDVCPTCKSREGKLFSWDKAPAHGHAGMADCCPQGYCRCWPEPAFRGW